MWQKIETAFIYLKLPWEIFEKSWRPSPSHNIYQKWKNAALRHYYKIYLIVLIVIYWKYLENAYILDSGDHFQTGRPSN